MVILGVVYLGVADDFKDATQEQCTIATETLTDCTYECNCRSTGQNSRTCDQCPGQRYEYQATTPKCDSQLLKPKLYNDPCTNDNPTPKEKTIGLTETCYVAECSLGQYLYKDPNTVTNIGIGLLIGGSVGSLAFLCQTIFWGYFCCK